MKSAVWECEGSKSPGPDGFNFNFFKNCWDVVKEDVLRLMGEFHANGKLSRGCNSSFIVLIPKKGGGCGIMDMRLISLVGSIYKILAKVLACRMKTVVGKVIGDAQSDFTKGLSILDGVVVLNEIVEDARKSKSKTLLFKVDFAKAYDSIDWEYLLGMLQLLNFPGR